ncbi:glutamyl-tRNA reductase-binding protein, chloroplastic [Momordica charantia]|uniref:Glutamyl-tRNA reductase-binding protein, chloroplastic n=1 Tax=Momordica charantia TaxID=3673 RepID=A0A6J1DSV5_MOMCH|nr:glutamyl-tRNA reductase-binding protein, chloroplastic [Momordica charantia]
MATVAPPSLIFKFRSPTAFNGRTAVHFPRSSTAFFNPRTPFSMAASTESTSQTVASGDANSNEIDISKLIQAHQENAARLSPAEEIRTLLDQSVRGMLSTFSRSFEGYPSGSLVDFACDADGTPVLAVSSLAEHAKNLATNPKCSLLVAKQPEDRGTLVVTLHGDVVSVSEEDRPAVRAAYLSKHPNAFWVDFGDFQFVYIKPKVIRYVSGVATASLGSGELSGEEYKAAKVDPIAQFSKPVTSHMNRDHTEDTKIIVRHWTSIPVDSAIMLDLDSLGINVKASYQGDSFKLRVPFPRRAENRKDVKTLVVEMLEAAKPHV